MKLKLSDSGIIVVKGVSTIKASAGEEEGVIDFIASTNSVDRDGDIVRQDGIFLDYYKQNPVFLWAHNSWEPPIGRSIESKMNDEGNFQIKVLFDLDDPFAHKIYRKYSKNFLKMVSIGFLPHELEERETGYGFVFTKTEIMEVSAVPVGSNRGALAIERGQDAAHTKSKDFGQWLKENNHVIIKSHPVSAQIKSPDAPATSEDTLEAPDEEPQKSQDSQEATETDSKTPTEPAQEQGKGVDEPQDTPEQPEDAPEASEEGKGADVPAAYAAKLTAFSLFEDDKFKGYTVLSNEHAQQLIKAAIASPVKASIEYSRNEIDVTEEGDESEKRTAKGAAFLYVSGFDDSGEGSGVEGIKTSIEVDTDALAEKLATKLAQNTSNKSKTIVVNVDGEAFEGKSAEQVAKAINDLIGSNAHDAEEPSEEDSPSPVKVPDASGPKPATLKVVSGNQD